MIEDGFLAARIREDEIADLDTASNLERSALRRDTGVVDFRNGVEDFAHALPGSHAPLKDVGDPAERNHRPREHDQIGVEGHEIAERDPAPDDFPAAQPQDQKRSEPEEEGHARKEHALEANQPAIAAHVLRIRVAEARKLVGLLTVGAHYAHS